MISVEFVIFLVALVALSQLLSWQMGRKFQKLAAENKRLARELHAEAKMSAETRAGLALLLSDAQKYRDLIVKTETTLEGMLSQYELRIRRADLAPVSSEADFVNMG